METIHGFFGRGAVRSFLEKLDSFNIKPWGISLTSGVPILDKFNVGTILKQSFLKGMKKAMDKTADLKDVQRLIGSRKSQDILTQATLEMKNVVKKLMQIYNCVGKANNSAT